MRCCLRSRWPGRWMWPRPSARWAGRWWPAGGAGSARRRSGRGCRIRPPAAGSAGSGPAPRSWGWRSRRWRWSWTGRRSRPSHRHGSSLPHPPLTPIPRPPTCSQTRQSRHSTHPQPGDRRIVDRGCRQPITGVWSVVGMRPGADRYTPDDTADHPTSSAESGFTGAYRLHRPGLVKLAAFIVGEQATGEDVVQDVFTRLHQRWDTLADPGDPLPYLRTAGVHGLRSAVKRRRRAGLTEPADVHRGVGAAVRGPAAGAGRAGRAHPPAAGGAGASVLPRAVGGGDRRRARDQPRDRKVHRGPRHRGPRPRPEGDPMIAQEEMARTADRLTDALTAAAAIMPPEEAHALRNPIPGRLALPASRPVRRRIGRLRAWLVPVGAAASVTAIILTAVTLAGHPGTVATPGTVPAPAPASAGPGITSLAGVPSDPGTRTPPPTFYVTIVSTGMTRDFRELQTVQVRRTSDGQVTGTTVPALPAGWTLEHSVSVTGDDRTFTVAAATTTVCPSSTPAQTRFYRFSGTSAGHVTGLRAVGKPVTGEAVSEFAASPDGTKVAYAEQGCPEPASAALDTGRSEE